MEDGRLDGARKPNMTTAFDWKQVAEQARALLKSKVVNEANGLQLNDGQRASLLTLCDRLEHNGVILADEVGMGKTRIAVALAHCVCAAGGRVAIIVPPGLGGQWQSELSRGRQLRPEMLRTYLQYLQAWRTDASPRPWFKEPVVLISHGFNRWPPGKLKDWRWSLLPETLARYEKDVLHTSLPYGYHDCAALDDPETRSAGASIASYLGSSSPSSEVRRTIEEVKLSIPIWKRSTESGRHSADGPLRRQIDRVTGLGLGAFDLVIIDEAHKSRGDDSLLSSLLDRVLVENLGSRRVGMSATPVELDASQWQQSLSRIGVVDDDLTKTIDSYVASVEKLRRSPHDAHAEASYVAAAAQYKKSLDPYLLRRDKREDAAVRSFVERTLLPTNSYRDVGVLPVALESMPPGWKKAVCAAEALSFVSNSHEDGDGKRQRLTIGNGHGVARLIDEIMNKNEKSESDVPPSMDESVKDKRKKRSDWWKEAMRLALQPHGSGETLLYQHPALLEAINYIEAISTKEKVLVFARYREPMQALMKLLNARALLRALENGTPWPQKAVPEAEREAVLVAHRQLFGREADLTALDGQLQHSYRGLENSRQRFRNGLLTKLVEGFSSLDAKVGARYSELIALLQEPGSPLADISAATRALTIISRALAEHFGETAEAATPTQLTETLMRLIEATGNRDIPIDDRDDLDAGNEAHSRDWTMALEQLDSDYAHTSGRFARQLHGDMGPVTRRLLQLGFNRSSSYPRVLIAQSTVGREGLNLHESCRTVVLLHLEWNPAVVEQQIGRVDRLGSLWQQLLEAEPSDSPQTNEVPRIRVRQIVFEGTYDEGHWRILEQRWNLLRAQLHGDILPIPADPTPEQRALLDRVAAAAPRFSPTALGADLAI